MKRYIEFETDDSKPIIVEVDVEDQAYGSEPAGRSVEIAEEAQQSFEDALSLLRPATETVVQQLRTLSPDEATVEFGIKLDAKAGAFLTSAGAAANFKVTLKWTSSLPEST